MNTNLIPSGTTISDHEPDSPLIPKPQVTTTSTNPTVHQSLASMANIANLLPTGTVLAFRTLAPSFSNKGVCIISNVYLTAILIAVCAIICFLSSFTDSYVDSNGKLYYGIATFKGLYVFNGTEEDDRDGSNNNNNSHADQDTSSLHSENEKEDNVIDLSKFRVRLIDFVHAFMALFVFLTFAFSDSDVQNCFFPVGYPNVNVLVMNLPLAAGFFSSFFFMLFPTTRRGIGYADMTSSNKSN